MKYFTIPAYTSKHSKKSKLSCLNVLNIRFTNTHCILINFRMSWQMFVNAP
jgi:hypothetical protein